MDWLGYVSAAVVLILGGYLVYAVSRLLDLDTLEDEERRASFVKRRDRMLTATGLWQWAVGLVLVSMGSWINTIALFGMGLLMIVGVRMNRKLNERFEGGRSPDV